MRHLCRKDRPRGVESLWHCIQCRRSCVGWDAAQTQSWEGHAWHFCAGSRWAPNLRHSRFQTERNKKQIPIIRMTCIRFFLRKVSDSSSSTLLLVVAPSSLAGMMECNRRQTGYVARVAPWFYRSAQHCCGSCQQVVQTRSGQAVGREGDRERVSSKICKYKVVAVGQTVEWQASTSTTHSRTHKSKELSYKSTSL